MDTDYRFWVIECKDRRHPGPKVIAACTIARITKLRHQPVPALRDLSIVNSTLDGRGEFARCCLKSFRIMKIRNYLWLRLSHSDGRCDSRMTFFDDLFAFIRG